MTSAPPRPLRGLPRTPPRPSPRPLTLGGRPGPDNSFISGSRLSLVPPPEIAWGGVGSLETPAPGWSSTRLLGFRAFGGRAWAATGWSQCLAGFVTEGSATSRRTRFPGPHPSPSASSPHLSLKRERLRLPVCKIRAPTRERGASSEAGTGARPQTGGGQRPLEAPSLPERGGRGPRGSLGLGLFVSSRGVEATPQGWAGAILDPRSQPTLGEEAMNHKEPFLEGHGCGPRAASQPHSPHQGSPVPPPRS